ncbi:ubiquitin carboxyl-terminal hydrolase 23 [Macadamia integrifolia]|uniref:ubiquitin carboxyl-terminal hydrolase 23 n=1 Tax=Macadamia integrifolia TaxID=60698 RepID=UPI001C4EC417|nr:ubiquitin carboxyl-terminal hydrolase 23 [Macadamia integrifolia]
MIESLICTSEMKKPGDGLSVSVSSSPSSNGTLFQRRIDFHPARKPFTGFSNGTGDFHIETLNPSSDSQRSASQMAVTLASVGKKSEGGDFFEIGLDPELISGATLRRIGAGLENLGNTCFLNSVLQCLTYTEPFAAYLQSGKHQSSCHTAGFCAMCAIQDHVRRALQSSGRIVAPKHLVMNLRCISRNFRNARQEDAHEYMVNLLESMHKCCLPSGVPSESPSAYDKSLVHKIFGGRLRSQVKCMQCSYSSNTFDPFLDLSLEIVKADSLLKALRHFTAMEQLDGGERQYQCQRCKQKVRAYKQLTVHKAPYVLTIHLKRFGSHIPGQKIDKKVQFGPTLDLKPFVSGNYEGELKYTLYGVLVHAGWSTHSGHYYCFVRTSSGMWYSLDDNRVVQVSERTVLEQKAYMLFYVRDRRSLVPKKPVDGFHKENMVSNIIENREWPNSAFSLKETVQNVLIEKRSCGMDYSGTAFQRDALNGSAVKGPFLKESSVKSNGLVVPEGLVVSKDCEMPLSKENLSKNPMKGLSVSNPITSGHLESGIVLQSAQSSVKCNSTAAHSNDVIIPPCGDKINGARSEGSEKELCVPVATPSDHTFAGTCFPEKPTTDNVADKIGVMNEKEVGKATPELGGDKKSEKVNAIRLSDPSTVVNNQIRVLSSEMGPSDSQCLKTGKNDPKSIELGWVEKSRKSNKINGHIQKEDHDHQHHRKVTKTKKKLQKCQVGRMFLGSNLLFRTSLTLRKRKKHKRSKHRNVVLRGFTQEDLLDENCISVDPGPSTSEKTIMLSLDSACVRKKKSRSDANKANGHATKKNSRVANGNFCTNNIDGDHRERSDQNNAELATNESPQKSVSLIPAANNVGTRETDGLEDQKTLVQSQLRSMLMRGFNETTIARWDEIELPTSQILGSSSRHSVNIGYVADEWDEEYDRGKRKKVKSNKISFEGPNPFQEVASMKTQLKKIKMDHTRSRNQPVRI